MPLLSVTVKKAKFIGDQATLSQFNTYVTLKLQNVKSTTVCVKGDEPCWEQDFLFETNNVDTGLIVEVWCQGYFWDRALGFLYIRLDTISYNTINNEKWYSIDTDLILLDGEVSGTSNQTGHVILIDCRWELPYDSDSQAIDFQRKLEFLNGTMTTHDRKQRFQQYLGTSGHSEDSDYTSDLNYPVGGQTANSSVSQYRNLKTPQRSLETSRENSYERNEQFLNEENRKFNMMRYDDYQQDCKEESFVTNEGDPLFYNSQPMGLQRNSKQIGSGLMNRHSLERQDTLYDDYENSSAGYYDVTADGLSEDRQWDAGGNYDGEPTGARHSSVGKLLPEIPSHYSKTIQDGMVSRNASLPATPIPHLKQHRQLPQPVVPPYRQTKSRCLPSISDVPLVLTSTKRMMPNIDGIITRDTNNCTTPSYNEDYNYAFQTNEYQSYGDTSDNFETNSLGGGRRLPEVIPKNMPTSSLKNYNDEFHDSFSNKENTNLISNLYQKLTTGSNSTSFNSSIPNIATDSQQSILGRVNKILPTPFQKPQTPANMKYDTTTTTAVSKLLPSLPYASTTSHTSYNFEDSIDNPSDYPLDDYDYSRDIYNYTDDYALPDKFGDKYGLDESVNTTPKQLPKVPDSIISTIIANQQPNLLPNLPSGKLKGMNNSSHRYDDLSSYDDQKTTTQYYDDGSTYKYTENENDLIASGDIKNTNEYIPTTQPNQSYTMSKTMTSVTTTNNNSSNHLRNTNNLYKNENDNKTTAIYNNNNYYNDINNSGTNIPSKIRIDNHYNQMFPEQENKTDPKSSAQAKSNNLLNGLGSIVNNSLTNFLSKPQSTTAVSDVNRVDPAASKANFFGINNVTSTLFNKNEQTKTIAVSDYYTSADNYGMNDSIMTTAPSTNDGYNQQERKLGSGRYLPKQQTTFGYDEEEEYIETDDYDQQYDDQTIGERNDTYDDSMNQQIFDESHYNTYDPRTDCFNEEDEFKYLQETEAVTVVSTKTVSTTVNSIASERKSSNDSSIYTTSSSYVNNKETITTTAVSVADNNVYSNETQDQHQLNQQDSYDEYIIESRVNKNYSITEEDEEEFEEQPRELVTNGNNNNQNVDYPDEDAMADEFIEEEPRHIDEIPPKELIQHQTPRPSIDNNKLNIASAIASAADEMKLGGEKLIDISEGPKKKSVTISDTTEEHPPRKLEISAKQRWHWAYNKIIMQLNVSTNLITYKSIIVML